LLDLDPQIHKLLAAVLNGANTWAHLERANLIMSNFERYLTGWDD
jgi:hypothetical protein